ncbi:MAG: hypothetical protein AB7S26_30810 [Sandaracinaceae bacterium]
MHARLLFASIALLALGCEGAAHADPPLPTTGLVAIFEPVRVPIPSSTSGRLTFTVENRGPEPATIDLDQLGSAIFGLDVMDDSGNRIPTLPPGVPPLDYVPRTETLPVGGRHRFEVSLNAFSPPLPAGDYRARVSVRGVTSTSVRFEIRPGGA